METSHDVGASVRSIASAFGSALEVFAKIRERRQRKKAAKSRNKSKATGERMSEEESQLVESLWRGSTTLQRDYADKYRGAGESFAKGDSTAQSSLAQILLKLNTGIANIIAAFIRHTHKPTTEPFQFDTRSMLALSNASQVETLFALQQLQSRISRRPPTFELNSTTQKAPSQSRPRHHHPKSDQRPRRKTKARPPEVARIPIKDSPQTQLVVIRPHPRRRSEKTPPKPHPTITESTPSTSPRAQRHDSMTSQSYFPPASPPLHFAPPVPHDPRLPESPLSQTQTPPHRRRSSKSTPSAYTILTVSTQIGEIPMSRWEEPWDYEEMERKNALAMQIPPVVDPGHVSGGKRTFWNFLRKK